MGVLCGVDQLVGWICSKVPRKRGREEMKCFPTCWGVDYTREKKREVRRDEIVRQRSGLNGKKARRGLLCW